MKVALTQLNPTTWTQDIGDIDFAVEIGDAKSDEFRSQVKVLRWDNEVNLSVRHIDDDIKAPVVTVAGEQIKAVKQKTECHFYKRSIDGTEGYEFEVILKEKPVSNKVQFSITTKGLKFFYQPSLKETWVIGQDGAVEITDTEVKDAEGKVICSCPENVVGSYAVYHDSKQGDYSKRAGKNYRAGKAFHIYRPKIIDNNGVEVWGTLNVDTEAGMLTIEIPQEFLDNAAYPVIVDPTFGYTTQGGSVQWTNHTMQGSWFTCPEAGTVDSISTYCSYNSNRQTTCAIYQKSDLSKLANSEIKAGGGIGWTTYTVSGSPALTNQDYWLFLWEEDSGINYPEINYDSSDAGKGHESTAYTYSTWPDPVSITAQSRIYSIYATYTASGAAEIAKVNSIALADIAKYNGIAKASVKKINGLTIQ